jgi:putative transposase
MYEVLQLARSTFYYETEIATQKEQEKAAEEQKLKDEIRLIFNKNRRIWNS